MSPIFCTLHFHLQLKRRHIRVSSLPLPRVLECALRGWRGSQQSSLCSYDSCPNLSLEKNQLREENES